MTPRRHIWHMSRIDSALTAGDRLSAAMDYLRASLADVPPELAEETVAEIVRTVCQAAEAVHPVCGDRCSSIRHGHPVTITAKEIL